MSDIIAHIDTCLGFKMNEPFINGTLTEARGEIISLRQQLSDLRWESEVRDQDLRDNFKGDGQW